MLLARHAPAPRPCAVQHARPGPATLSEVSAFRTIDELEEALRAADYLPDRGLSTALYLSLAL